MTKEELIKGEIYRYDKRHISEFGSDGTIQIHGDELMWSDTGWTWTLGADHATEEEKRYFKACKKAGRNIKKSEVSQLLGETEGRNILIEEAKEVEYVILNSDTCWGVKKGVVCSIVRQNEVASDQWVLTTNCVNPKQCHGYGDGNFLAVKSICAPSTREAYEAQQKAVVNIVMDGKVIGRMKEIKQELNKCSTINTNQNESNEKQSVKVQRVNLKTGITNPIRGLGLKGSGNKIKLGSNDRYNQTRFSSCKA